MTTSYEMYFMPNPKDLKTLPDDLSSLIRAARRGKLRFRADLVNGTTPDLGRRVLDCAARYATGCYRERRLRDLWEAYGAWQAHRAQP